MHAFLCDPAGRKYFSTDACNIRGCKSYTVAASSGHSTNERPPGIRAYVYTNAAATYPGRFMLLTFASIRVRKARTFTGLLPQHRRNHLLGHRFPTRPNPLSCHSDFNDSFATHGTRPGSPVSPSHSLHSATSRAEKNKTRISC